MLLQFLVNISKPFRVLFLGLIRPFFKFRYINSLPVTDETVLLVCNGPSLNLVDLNKFIGIQSYGLNKINLIYSKTDWRPLGIFIINGLVLRQMKDFINKNRDIPFYCDEKAIFLGVKATKYLRFGGISLGQHKSLFKSAYVTVAALQILVRSKPKRIIIVGLDHSFVVKNRLKKNEIEKFKGDDINHFSKNYFKNQFWGAPDLEMERYQLSKLKTLAEDLNVQILDATINGKLDVFEKISIDLAYSLASEK